MTKIIQLQAQITKLENIRDILLQSKEDEEKINARIVGKPLQPVVVALNEIRNLLLDLDIKIANNEKQVFLLLEHEKSKLENE